MRLLHKLALWVLKDSSVMLNMDLSNGIKNKSTPVYFVGVTTSGKNIT